MNILNFNRAVALTRDGKTTKALAFIEHKNNKVRLGFFADSDDIILSYEFIEELHKTLEEEGQGP